MRNILILSFVMICVSCSVSNDTSSPYMYAYRRYTDLYIGDYILHNKDRFISDAYGAIRWSPDGKFIAYVSTSDEYGPPGKEIYTINIRTKEKHSVTVWDVDGKISEHPSGGSNPVWSPDGTRIAFNRNINSEFGRLNDDIFVIDLDTSNGVHETRVTNNPYSDFVYDWSKDGNYLLYRSTYSYDTPDNPWDKNADWYEINLVSLNITRVLSSDSLMAIAVARYLNINRDIIYSSYDGISSSIRTFIRQSNSDSVMVILGERIIHLSLSYNNMFILLLVNPTNTGGYIKCYDVYYGRLLSIMNDTPEYSSPEFMPISNTTLNGVRITY